jgi:NAD(P)-dependent dehydrogenase (short-subunit alcohol dehydrogenase family)
MHLGEVRKLKEVAGTVVFLASAATALITGETIMVVGRFTGEQRNAT